jgi:hypothetical protein
MNGFLRLLEEPVKNWCPSSFIPQEFDRDFGLLDEDSLSEEANDYSNDYLSEVLLKKGWIPEIDNQKFIRILDKLRDAYNNDNSEQAQQECSILRPFLIRYQFTTPSKIRKAFGRTKYLVDEIPQIGSIL